MVGGVDWDSGVEALKADADDAKGRAVTCVGSIG